MDNLWLQVRKAMIESGWGTLGTARYPRSLVISWLAEGESLALRRLQIPNQREVALDIIGGQRFQSAGVSQGVAMLGLLINRAIYTDSAGSTHLLVATTETVMNQARPEWRNDPWDSAGVPTRYWYDALLGAIALDPIPGYNGTGVLALEFVRRPMRNPVIYETGTVSVTHDSAAVDGFATSWIDAKTIASGLRFGVREPVVAGVDDDPQPVRWYGVSAVTGNGALTLNEAWVGGDRTSAQYIIASPSVYQDNFEDMAMIPVEYAMAQMARAEGDSEAFQQHMGLFDSLIEEGEISLLAQGDVPATFGFAGETSHRPQEWFQRERGRRPL